MFCPKCGNQLEDTAAFCDKCGTKTGNVQASIEVQSVNSQSLPQESSKSKRRIKIWMLPVIFVVVATVLVVTIPIINSMISKSKLSAKEVKSSYSMISKSKLSVKEVKSSYIEAEWGYDIPEFNQMTIGEAFEGYFDNTSWKSLQSDEGVDYVEFQGDFLYPAFAESPYGGPEVEYTTTATVQFVRDTDDEEGFYVYGIWFEVIDDAADEWMKEEYYLEDDLPRLFLYAIYENNQYPFWVFGNI